MFDYLFLFDHSCGHDRMRPDGLSANLMNVNFGGKQPKSHPSILLQRNVYMGPFMYDSVANPQLDVGDIQSLSSRKQT